jgi:fumarate reductase subunit D
LAALILLVLVGVLVAFGFTRVRRRLNMDVTAKHWIYTIVVVVIVSLILWANAHHGTSHGTHH